MEHLLYSFNVLTAPRAISEMTKPLESDKAKLYERPWANSQHFR